MKQMNGTKLTLLCAAVYFAGYMTRQGVTVCLAEMIAAEAFTKQELTACTIGLFIVYGAGQIVSGWLGDRINPVMLMGVGLSVSATINLFVPFVTSGVLLCVLWCINGFCQALLWPPMARIMIRLLGDRYMRSCAHVFFGSSLATMLLYLLSPVVIKYFNWQTVFYISFTIGIVAAAIWFISMRGVRLEAESVPKPVGKKLAVPKMPASIAVIMLCIVAMGMLRDGITTWLPVYIMDTFELSSSSSIMSSVVLPIFSVVCYELTAWLYGKRFKNEMLCVAVEFGIAAIALCILPYVFDSSRFAAVLLPAIVVGCMHGTNCMLTAAVPARFGKSGGVAFYSGLLNFASYVGAAISTYGISEISDGIGWHSVTVIWAAVGIAGTLLAIATLPMIKKGK